jgi:phosphoglycolate phosphatase
MASVFFDLDGTLSDPREGITRCIQYALARLGVIPPSQSELERYIGPPLPEAFAELIGYPKEETVAEAVRLYRERFESQGIYENLLYPGIVELLDGIQDRGWSAYVVTSKPTPYAARIVDYFALGGFFVRVYGSRMDGGLMQKADLIRHVLREEGIPTSAAVMVGDRQHDVRGALANGVPVIGVTYGYGGREELREAGATWLCDDPPSVFGILLTHFA